jgi:tRNA threonylcarbamoyladenosine biosynthesis protein TsaE
MDAEGRFPLASNILTVKKTPALSRVTTGEAETLALARELGAILKPSDWVALMGELGSGKTFFVKGLGEALHLEGTPRSPTFAIVQVHPPKKGGIALRHVDLYRLAASEIPALEWEELHQDSGVTAVEWAEKCQYLWPAQCLPIRISHQGQDVRLFEFYIYGARSEEIIRRLKGKK